MSTTLDRTFPVARRSHRCDSCNGPIRAGEQYHRWKGTADEWEGVATLKECGECFGRYSQYRYLNTENRAIADAWLANLDDPYAPTDEHPFGLSKAEVHPDHD